MAYLVDTNVLSELRKGERCAPSVRAWFEAVEDAQLFSSVLVLGELQRGADRLRRRDARAARALDRWLAGLTKTFAQRILPVTLPIAKLWGSFGVPDPISTVDGLLAATAVHHDLVLVTRNVNDVERTGVEYLNPFE
jgi:predicted nucleic acid-binding protein